MATLALTHTCDSCNVANINGVRCHEHGCPDAWRDYLRECGECGCDYRPEDRYQRLCESCQHEFDHEFDLGEE